MQYSFTVKCSRCGTVYRVSEVGTRFPWVDNEEYGCPVCGEAAGKMKTHYNLDEIVVSLDETIEIYKNKYLNRFDKR